MLIEIKLVAVFSHSKRIIYYSDFSVFYKTDGKCKQCNNKCRRKIKKNLLIYPADTHIVVNTAVIWWRHLPPTQTRTFLA